VKLSNVFLCSRRRKLPHVCFLAVSEAVLKVRLDTKFSDIYIFYILSNSYGRYTIGCARHAHHISIYQVCTRRVSTWSAWSPISALQASNGVVECLLIVDATRGRRDALHQFVQILSVPRRANDDESSVVGYAVPQGCHIGFQHYDLHIRARAHTKYYIRLKNIAFTLIRAFKVYVRLILEYASCTWSPHHILKIQQVETVQRKFTKRLPGYASLCYKERLSRLDFDSLRMRRLRHDLLYITKLYLTYTVKLQMICSRLLTLCIHLELEAIRTNYTCITVLLMSENIFTVNIYYCHYLEQFACNIRTLFKFSSFKCFINSVDLTSHVSLGF